MKKSYRSFLNARKFSQQLQLKSSKEWITYCKVKNKPDDIPSFPNHVYKNKGWISWGDWLGTKTIAPQNKKFRSFTDSRKFARSLNLQKWSEWQKFCKSGQKPADIPSLPQGKYEDQFISVGDWLGTGRIANKNMPWQTFQEAKKFVKTLKLKSSREWRNYCISGKKPTDIPHNPNNTYKKEWVSMGDWLGTGIIAPQNRKFRKFEDARKFVKKLKLRNVDEWIDYRKSGNKPNDIPAGPQRIYKKQWVGWGNFLGTGKTREKKFQTFNDAKKFVHSLKLSGQKQWIEFCKSGNKPDDIPSSPAKTFKKDWINWGDWLGTGTIWDGYREFLSFTDAKKFAKKHKIKSSKEWRKFSKSNKFPVNIPKNPPRSYKKEWKGWGDFLSTGTISGVNKSKQYLSFDEARTFVRKLGIKSKKEWVEYSNSGKLPKDIPKFPWSSYAKTKRSKKK